MEVSIFTDSFHTFHNAQNAAGKFKIFEIFFVSFLDSMKRVYFRVHSTRAWSSGSSIRIRECGSRQFGSGKSAEILSAFSGVISDLTDNCYSATTLLGNLIMFS